jgi:hypothetical protein
MEEFLLACIWGEEMHYSRVSHFCEEKKNKKHTENSRWRQKSQVMKSFPFMVDRSAVEGDLAIWAISPHWRESGALL